MKRSIYTEVIAGTVVKTPWPTTSSCEDLPASSVDTDALHRSEARYSTDGDADYPTVTISTDVIAVHHETTGGGRQASTRLDGARGLFVFEKSGTYRITPGKYRHFVDGSISGEGSLASIVTFGSPK